LKEDSNRQAKLKENCTLQQATNLESGSIRIAKQTVIITKNETNSISMSIFNNQQSFNGQGPLNSQPNLSQAYNWENPSNISL